MAIRKARLHWRDLQTDGDVNDEKRRSTGKWMSSAGNAQGRGGRVFRRLATRFLQNRDAGPCSDSGSQTIFHSSDAYYNYVLTYNFGQGTGSAPFSLHRQG